MTLEKWVHDPIIWGNDLNQKWVMQIPGRNQLSQASACGRRCDSAFASPWPAAPPIRLLNAATLAAQMPRGHGEKRIGTFFFSVAFCSPAKSLICCGLVENPLVGKKLKSQQPSKMHPLLCWLS